MKYAVSQHDFETSTDFFIETAYVLHGPDGAEHTLVHVHQNLDDRNCQEYLSLGRDRMRNGKY
jgi:hypothetical protein